MMKAFSTEDWDVHQKLITGHQDYFNMILESEYENQRRFELNKKIVLLSKLLNLDSKKKIIESQIQQDNPASIAAPISPRNGTVTENDQLVLLEYFKQLKFREKEVERCVMIYRKQK